MTTASGLFRFFLKLSPENLCGLFDAAGLTLGPTPKASVYKRAEEIAKSAPDISALRGFASDILLLAKPENQQALRSEIRDLPDQPPELGSAEDRTVWAFLNHRDRFDSALNRANVSRRFQKPDYWNGYQASANLDSSVIKAKSARLRAELGRIFQKHDLSGAGIRIEISTYPALRGDGESRRFDILRRGPTEKVRIRDKLDRARTQQLNYELDAAVFVDDEDGLIDVLTDGGGEKFRRSIAQAFLDDMVDATVQLEKLAARDVHIEKLVSRIPLPCTKGEGAENARVVLLKLSKNDGSVLTLDARDSNEADVWEAWKRWRYGSQGGFGICEVEAAWIEFDLVGVDKILPASRNAKLVRPSGLNTKNWPAEHSEIAERLLRKWKLISNPLA
jgi:hypothetical protein